MNYYERHIGDYLKDTAHLSLLEHGVYTRLMDVYYTREAAIPDDQAARLVGARSIEEREALQVVLEEFFTRSEQGWVQQRCEREIERYLDKQTKAKRSASARWGAKPSQSEGNADASAGDMRTQCERIPTAYTDDEPTHSERNANGMHRAPVPRLQSPDTNHHKEIPPLPPEGEEGAFDAPGFLLDGNASPGSVAVKQRSGKSAYSAEFEAAWSAYPDRPNHSKQEAWKAWNARIRAGVPASQILEGVKRYAAYIKASQKDPQFVKHAATFFGPSEHYLSDWTAPSSNRASRHSGFDQMDYSEGVDKNGRII
ncbi:DUF1376 domain-containing protein [Diaphorobacter ruginosibacter]|uniref:YdaU family protein n=1 Tax=Diaphorobacter ruginosibacter TaxID=1715720 RepID=UPI003340664C